jgi:hypothetical protein
MGSLDIVIFHQAGRMVVTVYKNLFGKSQSSAGSRYQIAYGLDILAEEA